ncbi:ABC transporter substrate-binding protein [Bifidobacterium avesanii]|uniref:Extracellular solute-binding protein n=1 Tax=Bifidobacterium avesanii TaxID=1798157 RepID=A0A7K3THT4_9BIFI|nr:extracellular solute-binding protein [Bifidobacterium avesanii]KAB8292872.1 ABC transporter substrate-binding protein [Bifidobacterium avesanii]NEG78476.1 extracellular solute-binding protein [Bifidobacterium avesanii]
MRIARKHLAVPAAIAAAAMALAGCGAGGDTAGGSDVKLSDEPVTLHIAWWGSDTRVKMTQEAISKFEAANPNIKVETEYKDWSGYWDNLATHIAGGDMPDVIQMDELYLASYASQGTLYDLGKTSEFLDLNQMDSSLRDMGKVDGVQYAAPISTTPMGVLVNNDLLKKLGLTLPDTSKWTWDDMIDFAKQIVEKSNGEVTGIAPLNNGMSLQLWARQNNESLFKDGKVAISEATLTSYLQMAYDWTHGDQIAGTPDRLAENSAGTVDQGDMAQGKQAMTFTQATQIGTYAKASGADMSLVPMPNLGKNAKYGYFKPGMYWAMGGKTEHPAEAAKLIDFLINNEDAIKTLGTDRGLPGNNKLREQLASSATGTDKKALEFPSAIADTIGDAPEITPNGASDLDKTIARYEQQVYFGQKSAADAAKEMTAELQSAIDSAA